MEVLQIMAITCVSTITPIDVANKIVSVSAAITNDAEPTQTVTIKNADISTAPKKAAVADSIWQKYLAKRSEQLLLDSLQDEITTLEGQLNSDIEGRSI